MIISQFQQIMCHFANQKLFNHIKGEIAEGQRIGLVGRNGEGKTALLNVLAGNLQPTEGAVTWKKGCAVGLLQQSPEENGEQTVHQLLKDVFSKLLAIQHQLEEMEQRMESATSEAMERLLQRYGAMQDDFIQRGGYNIEVKIEKALVRIELLDRPVLSKKQMALDFQMEGRSGKDVVRMEGIWKDDAFESDHEDRQAGCWRNQARQRIVHRLFIPAYIGDGQ